jgi:hypothetical protein
MNDLENLKEIVAQNTCIDINTLTVYDFFFKLDKVMTDKAKRR